MNGELVGINTAIVSRSGGCQGIGFAIPSNMAKSVMDSLVKHGKVVRGWLGVTIQDLDKSLSEAMEMEDTNGVLIAGITENSPAEKATLKRGDIILRVNGEKMNSTGRLRNTIATMGAGANLNLDILRDGKKKSIALTLGELPDEFGGQISLDEYDGILGGMTVAPLNELTREIFELQEKIKAGVVITKIDSGSSAEDAGLKPGDIILEVNRNDVNSVEEFANIYKKSKNSLLMLIYRQGRTFYLVFKK